MSSLSVRFRGVRGSLATPGRDTARYGGNTACVELVAGEERIVFDMGSGLRQLGAELPGGSRVTFFLSHYHWDHILGLPFFAPAYDPTSELVIHGATRQGRGVRELLAGQMVTPYFPVGLGELRAGLQFRSIESGAQVEVGEARVTARELNHPGGALGFRVDHRDASVVYATDFEHGTNADEALIDLARGCDVLIYDAMFTPAEYPRHVGWGHSTWEAGAQLARKAGARRLFLFHYNPSHDDRQLDALVKQARTVFPATEGAREGRTYPVTAPAIGRRRPAAQLAAHRVRAR